MRAFVIGNGPSLKNTPLDLLRGEITYAVNSINLIYDQTDWRPSNVVWVDAGGWDSDEEFYQIVAEQFEALSGTNFYLRHEWAGEIEQRRVTLGEESGKSWPFRNPTYMHLCLEHIYCNHLSDSRPEAWHLPVICRYAGSLNVALQLAVLEQRNPIYLLGCDLGFEEGAKNHFHPNYLSWDDFPWDQRDATLTHMHQCAKRSSDEAGIQIYNVTLGGALEVYPRTELKELF